MSDAKLSAPKIVVEITDPQAIEAGINPAVYRGKDGPPGPPGASGVYVGSGEPPENANVWINPEGQGTTLDAMLAYLSVRNAETGQWQGIVALKGDKGDTPVKGVDYWTEEEKAEIVQTVLDALPDAEEESF